MNTLYPADPGTRYRHADHDSVYCVLGTGELHVAPSAANGTKFVIYRDEASGTLLVQSYAEFFATGQFRRLDDGSPDILVGEARDIAKKMHAAYPELMALASGHVMTISRMIVQTLRKRRL